MLQRGIGERFSELKALMVKCIANSDEAAKFKDGQQAKFAPGTADADLQRKI